MRCLKERHDTGERPLSSDVTKLRAQGVDELQEGEQEKSPPLIPQQRRREPMQKSKETSGARAFAPRSTLLVPAFLGETLK